MDNVSLKATKKNKERELYKITYYGEDYFMYLNEDEVAVADFFEEGNADISVDKFNFEIEKGFEKDR